MELGRLDNLGFAVITLIAAAEQHRVVHDLLPPGKERVDTEQPRDEMAEIHGSGLPRTWPSRNRDIGRCGHAKRAGPQTGPLVASIDRVR